MVIWGRNGWRDNPDVPPFMNFIKKVGTELKIGVNESPAKEVKYLDEGFSDPFPTFIHPFLSS